MTDPDPEPAADQATDEKRPKLKRKDFERELDVRRWYFINPELTVHLHREPVGEWICLDAITMAERHGVGTSETVISDERGRIGRGVQTLLLGEH